MHKWKFFFASFCHSFSWIYVSFSTYQRGGTICVLGVNVFIFSFKAWLKGYVIYYQMYSVEIVFDFYKQLKYCRINKKREKST